MDDWVDDLLHKIHEATLRKTWTENDMQKHIISDLHWYKDAEGGYAISCFNNIGRDCWLCERGVPLFRRVGGEV